MRKTPHAASVTGREYAVVSAGKRIGFVFLAALPFGALAASPAPLPTAPAPGPGFHAVSPPSDVSPRRVVELFDSLTEAATPEAFDAARDLTVGTMRRLFPTLVEMQTRFASRIDTALSKDSVLGEKRDGEWAALKFRSVVVFRKPFLGMTRIASIQAAHLWRDSSQPSAGWRIAEVEELSRDVSDTGAALVVRSGRPAGLENNGPAGDLLFPLSRLAPSKEDMGRLTRLRLRLAMRDGTAPDALPAGPGQRVVAVDGGAGRAVLLETRAVALPPVSAVSSWADSLAVYRASTPDLDLTDKMLRTRAAKLKQGSPGDVETARRIWRFVSTSFDYRLGATLFATSREALRDRTGDCSEAAVLTAALLRAAGIPSRVVMGYATLESGTWIGHAWAEAFLGNGNGGQWIGVDAALREFPAGPARVALVTLSGEREMGSEATNLMLRTLSNLDIQIVEAGAGSDGTEPVPLREHPGAALEARRFWEQVLRGMGE